MIKGEIWSDKGGIGMMKGELGMELVMMKSDILKEVRNDIRVSEDRILTRLDQQKGFYWR